MADYPTQHDEFFMWVGFCITAWARTEEWLFKICTICLGARKDRAAIVYYRTPTVDARLKLVDELVRSVLPKPKKKDGGHDHPDLILWDKLRKDISNLLGTRRRIAHHPARGATSRSKERPFWWLDEASWFEIYMSEGERLRTSDKDVALLKKDDLVRHVHDLHLVTTRAAKFYRSVLPKHVG